MLVQQPIGQPGVDIMAVQPKSGTVLYLLTCAGGQFRPNLNIQPIRKINSGLESSKISVGNHLHPCLMFFEWPDAIFKMTPAKFQVPCGKTPSTLRPGANSNFFRSPHLAIPIIIDLNERLDLEKLVWKHPVWDVFIEMFDLL